MSRDPVIVWTVNRGERDGRWVMVRHRTRGWELPGGGRKAGESASDCAIRELFEETGLSGRVTGIAPDLVGGCTVVRIEIDGGDGAGGPSADPSIVEWGWHDTPPPRLHWGEDEILSIAAHDWSSSSAAGSSNEA